MSGPDPSDSITHAFSRLLNGSDRVRVLRTFNDTATPLPTDQLIHRLFEEQVVRNPGAPAVIDGDCKLTYEQLNSCANGVAHALLGRGVRIDQRVGLYVERSIDSVIGMLGIMKAGAAYVPLDPADPAERLGVMVHESDPVVILTQRQLLEAATALHRPVMIFGDESPEATANPVLTDLNSRNLAYVMYTSGSTGRPHGVMIEHRGVLRLVMDASYAPLGCGDCVAHCSSLTFDASTWEVWAPLVKGARILVVRQSLVTSPISLNQTLLRNGATALWLTVGAFNKNVDALDQAFGGLSYLLIGGDVVNPLTVRRALLKSNPPRHLINGYGPTEATTFATAQTIKSVDESAASIPIGRPVGNTSIYILNDRREALPIGMVGEICIGGAGVARGYLNRPDVTAARFIPNPFSGDSNERLYCTGDRGRWRTDGTVEFLGRNDFQVKIRGLRVEPHEVECALREFNGIRDAVVVAQQEDSGEKQLVGYVVPDMPNLKAAAGQSRDQASDIVEEWRNLYEETYAAGGIEPSFITWNSSYTGEPIPYGEMQEWLHHVIERIRQLKPRKVLEIGCGVGLILERIAPECEAYFGTDISAEALNRLGAWLSTRADLRHVELKHATALDLDEMSPESFDTIILNSVVQYFPDIAYLCAVLEKALRVLCHGGRIFIGDIRHYGLLAAFHSSVQLERAEPYVSAAKLKVRVMRAIENEKELVIEPKFFADFGRRTPGIGEVRILLKRGKSVNELTRYRYDVVLEKGVARDRFEPVRATWESGREVSHVLREMRENGVRTGLIQNIPNIRLVRDLVAAELIEKTERTRPAENMKQMLSMRPLLGEDPDEFEAVAESYGYDALISWNADSTVGHFDVEVCDRAFDTAQPEPRPSDSSDNHYAYRASLYERYANDPWGKRLHQQLPSMLREYLSTKLPSFMVPCAFVILDSLPLSAKGKLDRNALPPVEFGMPTSVTHEPPHGRTEEVLAGIWQEVLQVEQIGRKDNFFGLGGHSMSAARLAAKIGERFGIRFQIQQVLRNSVLCDMGQSIDQLRLQAEGAALQETTQVEEGTVYIV